MVVIHNLLLRPFTVGVDKLPSKTFIGCQFNDILLLLSPIYHRFSLLLYLVLVSGAAGEW
jgi:hypothetical protein